MLPAFHRIFQLHWFILAPKKEKEKEQGSVCGTEECGFLWDCSSVWSRGEAIRGRSGNVNGIRPSELAHTPL